MVKTATVFAEEPSLIPSMRGGCLTTTCNSSRRGFNSALHRHLCSHVHTVPPLQMYSYVHIIKNKNKRIHPQAFFPECCILVKSPSLLDVPLRPAPSPRHRHREDSDGHLEQSAPLEFPFPPSLWGKWKIEGYGRGEDASKPLVTKEKSQGSEVAVVRGCTPHLPLCGRQQRLQPGPLYSWDLPLWGWWEQTAPVFPAIPVCGNRDFKGTCEPGMEAHACDPSVWRERKENQELKAIHGYTVSLKLAWTTGMLSG